MARENLSIKTASFLYDFIVDGGNVGVRPMGAFIPANSVILYGSLKIVSFLATIGAGNVSIGWVGNLTALMPLVNGNTLQPTGTILEGVDLIRAMVETPTIVELIINFDGQAEVINGRFIYFVKYIEFDE